MLNNKGRTKTDIIISISYTIIDIEIEGARISITISITTRQDTKSAHGTI